MNEDILGIKINKDLQWFKMTLANGEEIDLVKKQDYIKLQNNWNELKKFVQEELKEAEDDFAQEDFIKVLDRMQELEQVKDEN